MRVLFMEFFDCHFCIRFQEKILLSSVCNGAGLPGRAKAAGTQLLATFYLFSPYYDKDMRRLSREMYSGIIVYNHFQVKSPPHSRGEERNCCIQKTDP